ncbi:MAG: AMP-binding protein [Bacteroidota bacterium]|nr:AMP-binding protein [Bacteroidota bacterium]
MIPLFKYFNSAEKCCGSKIFIQTGNNKYTFDEVQEYVTRYSVYFKSQNVNTGDYIGILLENNENFVFSVLALMNIGAIPVFFNAKNSVAEVSELFNFTGCKYMISRKEFTLPNIILPSKETLNGNIDFHPENITPANTAIIIFTSGSRGTPKAVKITCSNLLNSALASNSIIGYVNGDSWMATLPFYHIGGFSILIRALTFRILLYLPDSLKVSNLKKALDSYNPNHISLVSTQVIKLLEDGYTPTDGLKSVLLGGGFFNNDLIAKLLDKKWPIIKVYGSTESSSLISAHRVKKDDHLPSAGKAVLENKIAVYDKAGDAVPVNTEGEIVLSGPVVTNGYLNNMGETARKFRNGCYFSGDYGYLDNDGYLYLVTRREDLIISGGETSILLKLNTYFLNIRRSQKWWYLQKMINIGDKFRHWLSD